VVLIVLAVIGGVVAARLADRSFGAARAACEWNAGMINTAIERWHFDKGEWPAADLSDIGRDRHYFPNGIPCCPVTGRRYRMDPKTHRVLRDCH